MWSNEKIKSIPDNNTDFSVSSNGLELKTEIPLWRKLLYSYNCERRESVPLKILRVWFKSFTHNHLTGLLIISSPSSVNRMGIIRSTFTNSSICLITMWSLSCYRQSRVYYFPRTEPTLYGLLPITHNLRHKKVNIWRWMLVETYDHTLIIGRISRSKYHFSLKKKIK